MRVIGLRVNLGISGIFYSTSAQSVHPKLIPHLPELRPGGLKNTYVINFVSKGFLSAGRSFGSKLAICVWRYIYSSSPIKSEESYNTNQMKETS